MKTTIFLSGLSMTILVTLFGGGVVYAKNTSPAIQIQSQNARQKMPHSKRKEAASRLKHSYKHNRLKQPNNFDKIHQEQNGQANAGGGA